MSIVTKSGRLKPEETRALADLAAKLGCSEAALLRCWAIEGIRETQIDLAILYYTKGRVSHAARSAKLERSLFEADLAHRGPALERPPNSRPTPDSRPTAPLLACCTPRGEIRAAATWNGDDCS